MCVTLLAGVYTDNSAMMNDLMIVGGGIGGLATALACVQQGAKVHVLEQAAQFGEVGAGIQMGPNVVRVLEKWGLGDALKAVAAFPARLEVRNALSGQMLGILPLHSMPERYGAAYATIARADLHGVLLQAVQQFEQVQLQLNTRLKALAQQPNEVQVQVSIDKVREESYATPVLIGADGLWSKVRAAVLPESPVRDTGHLAFRAMLPQSELPLFLRSQVVTAWLGPRFHAVQYPVRGGEWLNVVAIVQGQVEGDVTDWNHQASASEVRACLANAASPLLDLLHAIDHWRLWALRDRPPMRSAAEHAFGRIALLGDAAHPMRPYLAQGAGMAIEDAANLATVLQQPGIEVQKGLEQFAHQRWQRNARVQKRAERNGKIFHMRGGLRVGRDWSLRLLGHRLLDIPWLYSR